MLHARENCRRAIEFRGPGHLPTTLGVNLDRVRDRDEGKRARLQAIRSRLPNDILSCAAATPGNGHSREPDGTVRWTDEWGTGWMDSGNGAITTSHPLEDGYVDYAPPDPFCPQRFAGVDETLNDTGNRYVLGRVWFTLFERLWMLRGFENMLVDPYEEEERFACLRDRIVEFNLAMIDRWLERKVDGIYFSDDWGSQRALLMRPDDWRIHYKPAYRRMFRRVRDGGAHVWMHLCGNVSAIIPDLIEIGLNVLNPIQPQAMDVGELARRFGGQICFNGGVDVQGTMVRGTPQDVRDEVHRLVELFGGNGGGYIGGTSHSIMPETPLDNIIALYEAFAEHV